MKEDCEKLHQEKLDLKSRIVLHESKTKELEEKLFITNKDLQNLIQTQNDKAEDIEKYKENIEVILKEKEDLQTIIFEREKQMKELQDKLLSIKGELQAASNNIVGKTAVFENMKNGKFSYLNLFYLHKFFLKKVFFK